MEKKIKNDNYYYEVARINIREQLKLKKITQEELANMTGYTTAFIGKIVSPKMKKHFSLATLGRIADALEISISKLLIEK